MIGLGSAPRRRRCGPAGAPARRRWPSGWRARPPPRPGCPTASRALFIIVNMQARPLVLLADQPAGRAALVAEHHGAGRRGMHAELVLEAGAEAGRCAAPGRPSASGRNLGTRNSEMPRVPGRRVGQTRQDQMDDVVRHVVVAVGDVDLLAGDPVGAVARGLGPGPQRADVRARLRLGEVHGAGPFARHELGQVEPLAGPALPCMPQRLDGARGQHRAEREGRVAPNSRSPGRRR